ncbi:MAG: 3-isopropylmalate dehydratase small subunit [Hyphomicrobiaceae bacterium]|nr:3-isopropylmalate dehydratase small subunit [Hyphomicrobiaceae bacterium]
MEKFTSLTSIAAPLNIINIDTDMIIPKTYLKTIKRTGLGKALFAEMRYDVNLVEIPNFILNKSAYRETKILVTGKNFGCGSSREHAPWALLDFGIRAIIAPSFADIFYNNSFKNGILPIRIPENRVNTLFNVLMEPQNSRITVDLNAQTVQASDGIIDSFEIESHRKYCLLNGIDDIAITIKKSDTISAYEKHMKLIQPWL